MGQSTRTGAEALMDALEQNGVEYIFGYSGGAALPLFDALATSGTKIKLILTRHEQGATHMADGYARVSGKPGVVLVTSGPGAGNTMTGMMTAQMDSVPVVVISGQVPTHMLKKDAFQEADIIGMSTPVTKYNYLVLDTNGLPNAANEAFRIAASGRPGPVLLDVPKDVSAGLFTGTVEPPAARQTGDPPAAVNKSSLRTIASAWRRAKRPVILAGHGVIISGAEKELRRLAERQNTPVTTTLLGKGAFPETHRLSLGMLGMHGTAYANKAMVECDFLLNVGSRFDDRIVGQPDKFCKDAFIAHIDIDAYQIGKIIEPSKGAGVVADARLFITALSDEMALKGNKKTSKPNEWTAHLDEYKRSYPLNYETGDGLTMQQVIDEAYRLSRGEAIVTADVGQHQMWAAQFYKTDRPNTWLTSGGAGTMGFGFPAAIGAQVAKPKKQVIAFVGDGGFQMTSYELATACNHGLPIKVIVLDNKYLGMVRQWQELFLGNRESGVEMVGSPDFVKLAESYGAAGVRIDSVGKLRTGLKKAFSINDRPVVVHAMVRERDNVFPMIASGAPLEEMIVEAPTEKLAPPTGST